MTQITFPETATEKLMTREFLADQNPDDYDDEYTKIRIAFWKENLPKRLKQEAERRADLEAHFMSRYGGDPNDPRLKSDD